MMEQPGYRCPQRGAVHQASRRGLDPSCFAPIALLNVLDQGSVCLLHSLEEAKIERKCIRVDVSGESSHLQERDVLCRLRRVCSVSQSQDAVSQLMFSRKRGINININMTRRHSVIWSQIAIYHTGNYKTRWPQFADV